MFDVCLITPYYPPHIGGVELHVANLAKRLNKKYKIAVISSKPSNADFQVKSIFLPYTPIPLSFPKVSSKIYHSHIPSPFFSIESSKLAKEFNSPHIITYHNDVVIPDRVNGYKIPSFSKALIEKFNEKLVIPLLDRADVIIATTRSYAETSPILYKFIEKVRIVPNGVDIDVFTPSKGIRKDQVVYVGRLVEYKGLANLIKAMKVVQEVKDVKLVVVGDGEDRFTFEEMCKNLRVKAIFTGKLKLMELIEVLRKSKLLVLPSFSRLEAFGIVLLEAMACGTPVAGANVPGVGEISSKAGFVFNDWKELANIILEVVDNDTLVRKLGKKGRSVVEEKYSWNKVVNELEKIYNEVIT